MTVWAEGTAALPAEARGAARRAWSLLDEAQRLGLRVEPEAAPLRAAQELVTAARRHALALRFTFGPGHVSAPGGVVQTAQDPAASVYALLFGQGLRALVVHPEAEVGPLADFLQRTLAGERAAPTNPVRSAPGASAAVGAIAPGIFVERVDRFVEEHRRRHRAFLTPFEQLVSDLLPEAPEVAQGGPQANPLAGGEAGGAWGQPPGAAALPPRETQLLAAAIDRAETALVGASQDADEAAHRLRALANQEADLRAQVSHLITVLVRLAIRTERPVGDAHLSAAIAGGLGILLSQGDAEAFMAGLRGVFAVAQALGGQVSPATIGVLVSGVTSPATAAAVARHAERIDQDARRWLLAWFGQRGAAVPAHAWLTAFSGVSSAEGLHFVRALLAARPEVDRSWWLAQARTREVVSVAEALVALGQHDLSEPERLVFVGALAHPAAQTRIQAIGLLGNDGAEAVREGLGRLLLDPVRAVRQAALGALVQRGHAGDARHVVAVLRSPGLAELPLEEQEHLAEALARLGGEHCLRVFKELLRMEDSGRLGRLFRRELLADEPVRRAALHGLAALGTADALALLDQVRRRAAPPLEACAAHLIEICTGGLFTRRALDRPGQARVATPAPPTAIELEVPVDLEAGWRLVVPEAFGLMPDLSIEDLLMGYLVEGAQAVAPPAPAMVPPPAAVPGAWKAAARAPLAREAPVPLPTLESAAEPAQTSTEEVSLPLLDSGAEGAWSSHAPEGESGPGLELAAWAEALADLSGAGEASAAPATWAGGRLTDTPETTIEPLGPPSPESDEEANLVGPAFAWPGPEMDREQAEPRPGQDRAAFDALAPQGEDARPAWLAEGTDQSLWAETPGHLDALRPMEGLAVEVSAHEVAPELASLLEALEAPGPPDVATGSVEVATGPIDPGWQSAEWPAEPRPDAPKARRRTDLDTLNPDGHLTAGPPPLRAVAAGTLDSLPQFDTAAPPPLAAKAQVTPRSAQAVPGPAERAATPEGASAVSSAARPAAQSAGAAMAPSQTPSAKVDAGLDRLLGTLFGDDA